MKVKLFKRLGTLIFLLIVAFFILLLNPSDAIIKKNEDLTDSLGVPVSFEINNEEYIISENSDFDRILPNFNYVYKDKFIVKEVYTSRLKDIKAAILDMKFFLVGNERLFNNSAYSSDEDLYYHNSELIPPVFSAENIKEICLCNGIYKYYLFNEKPSNSIYTLNGLLEDLSTEKIPKDGYEFEEDEISIVETFNDKEYISRFVREVMKQSFIVDNGQKISNLSNLYRVEFADESFPFYLIVKTETQIV